MGRLLRGCPKRDGLFFLCPSGFLHSDMKKKPDRSVVFKPYVQNQPQLLPPSLDELIPKGHLVRVVNAAIDRMDIDSILSSYKGGGTSSYHPKMLLKVIIYGYSQRIYSSRRIAKAIRENIHFMWLAGGNRPDFRTINRFRSSRLKSSIETIFYAVVELLLEEGLIDLRDYFLDGTKLEANANKYSFVWGKNTKRHKENLQKKVKELLKQIDDENDDEDRHYGEKDLAELGSDEEVSSDRIEAKLKELEERLAKAPKDKPLKRVVRDLKRDYLPRQRTYEQQERLLGERASYSKTDPDATFMRMKDDHMKNGQLKAAYNVQMGTQNPFIVGYSLHQKTTDSPLLIPHLEGLKARLGKLPERICADAGYGSEENYAYLDDKPVEAFVKYNWFHREQKKKYRENPFLVANLPYDEAGDFFTCPAGKQLRYLFSSIRRSVNGYDSTQRIYESEGCEGCELRERCYRGENNRRLTIRPVLQNYRKLARELLHSKEGKILRSRRGIEVEAVFGQIKENRQFRRFLLRGLDKVTIEYGLVAIAHNLMKWQVKGIKNRVKGTKKKLEKAIWRTLSQFQEQIQVNSTQIAHI